MLPRTVKMTTLELSAMSDAIVDDVRTKCGEELVRRFYDDNREVAAAFISCTWVRVRTYLHVQSINALMKGTLCAFVIGVVLGFVLGRLW